MTCEIRSEEIPEIYRNTLAATAAQIIKTHGTTAYVSVPFKNKKFYYILWVGLNSQKQLEECYFLSDDFINNSILTNR